jgi:hypothetical protein
MKVRFLLSIALILDTLHPRSSQAQWQSGGLYLGAAPESQETIRLATDGANGAIIVWTDVRNGSGNRDIHAAKVGVLGETHWSVPVCTAINDQQNPEVVSDGSGGAFIAWEDRRTGNYDIYIQHIDRDGMARWTPDGVALWVDTYSQRNPHVVADGEGGAVAAWEDARAGQSYGIRAQRIKNGELQWVPEGVQVRAGGAEVEQSRGVSDGAGGAILAWRERPGVYREIRAQRILKTGELVWGTDEGLVVCLALANQGNPRSPALPALAPDGANGVIIIWDDRRANPYHAEIYAQHVNASGGVQFVPSGIPVCTGASDKRSWQVVGDMRGNAIVVWEDDREATGNTNIYAQRIATNLSSNLTAGDPATAGAQWPGNGVPICTEAHEQELPVAASDEAGGAIVAWVDRRGGNPNIYSQRISASGGVQYQLDGVALSPAASDQVRPAIVSDGGGVAIVTWQQNSDIYAQRVDGLTTSTGSTPPLSALEVRQNYPNPFSGTTEFEVNLPAQSDLAVDVYDVAGRRVRTHSLGESAAGWHRLRLDGLDDAERRLPAGVYFYRVTANGTSVTKKMVIVR